MFIWRAKIFTIVLWSLIKLISLPDVNYCSNLETFASINLLHFTFQRVRSNLLPRSDIYTAGLLRLINYISRAVTMKDNFIPSIVNFNTDEITEEVQSFLKNKTVFLLFQRSLFQYSIPPSLYIFSYWQVSSTCNPFYPPPPSPLTSSKLIITK